MMGHKWRTISLAAALLAETVGLAYVLAEISTHPTIVTGGCVLGLLILTALISSGVCWSNECYDKRQQRFQR